ncbi:hypothetical protein PoB_000879500 [Plakobranchus ocellatus]|uniref:Uncharacterized protein n=1 Tax=Plakobranchus ocellatus TaxID=259542 RepID=A0AAV3YHT3_9GAST|nr:hypothetical protein PoB_000879500 [Plakobranchus ocellatus]
MYGNFAFTGKIEDERGKRGPFWFGDNDLLHYLPAEMETYLSAVMLRNTVIIQDFAMAFNITDREGLCGQMSRHLGLYARLVNISATDQATLQR